MKIKVAPKLVLVYTTRAVPVRVGLQFVHRVGYALKQRNRRNFAFAFFIVLPSAPILKKMAQCETAAFDGDSAIFVNVNLYSWFILWTNKFEFK